jgi:hypothetical protein
MDASELINTFYFFLKTKFLARNRIVILLIFDDSLDHFVDINYVTEINILAYPSYRIWEKCYLFYQKVTNFTYGSVFLYIFDLYSFGYKSF